MKYLIDTDICIYIMNERNINVINKFKQLDIGDIGISVITVSELQYGVSKSAHKKTNQLRLDNFLMPFEIIDYDYAVTSIYGDIRFQLEKKGEIIGALDLQIAAQAISRDLILITNNIKEFKRVKGLKLENWIE